MGDRQRMMKFSLKFIQSRIKEEVLFFWSDEKNPACGSVRFWEGFCDQAEDVMYLITSDNLLQCMYDPSLLPANLICITKEEEIPAWAELRERFSKTTHILFVSDVRSEKEWMNYLSNLMQKYLSLEQKLILALMKNERIEDILDLCEEILDNPVILVDMSMQLLGQSHTMLSEKIPNRYWYDTYRQQYVGTELISALRENDVLTQVARSTRSLMVEIGEEPYMTKNIYWKETKVASMSVFSVRHILREEEGEILDQISELLAERAKLLQTKLMKQQTKEHQIIMNILKGQRYSEKIVKHALRNFSGKLSDGVRLLKLQDDDESGGYGMPDYITAMIERNVGYSIRIPMKDAFVFLCSNSPFDEPDLIRILSGQLTKLDIKCGCSLTFYEWEDLYQQYLFASAALTMGIEADPQKAFYEYSEYAAFYRVSICQRQTDIHLLCLPEIWKLYQYDQKTGNELVNSFYYYLIYCNSLSKAAQILNIHKTTLSYRLRKIEDMVSLDWNDGLMRQQIVFSCEIIRYIRIFGED